MLLLTLLTLCDATLFTWTGSDKMGMWKHWDWSKITHVGFFSDPSSELQDKARSVNAKLIHAAGLPEPAQWTNATARNEWVASTVANVVSKNYDGVAFDFEGNGLSKAQKDGYSSLASETATALAATKRILTVCVGGRPAYEWRDYNYTSLAKSASHLFVMAYDLIFWDDYTCLAAGTCSPADAPYRTVELGIQQYLQAGVPSNKLVLGLPWYGQIYMEVLGVPFNMGQIPYGDVLQVIKNHSSDASITLDEKDMTYVLKCGSQCTPAHKGKTIWFDNSTSLTPKYALAKKYGLQGVGMWQALHLDYINFPEESTAMWNAINAWDA